MYLHDRRTDSRLVVCLFHFSCSLSFPVSFSVYDDNSISYLQKVLSESKN